MNYYNEFDPFAAQWLRNLISEGLIPDGDVDERDMRHIEPSDLAGYTQCHFFAGIGGWSLALQLAGWPSDVPVWTGSPPCQPFSSAGKQNGKDDERHLWPKFFDLIRECQPPVIFGEQVAPAIKHGWLDDLCADLEKEGYAAGAVVLPACSVGAPHKRDRIFFVGDSQYAGLEGYPWAKDQRCGPGRDCANPSGSATETGVLGGMADADGTERRAEQGLEQPTGSQCRQPDGDCGCHDNADKDQGFWRDADWLYCRDEKWRPVEPGTFPLGHGFSSRVGRLRAYGNAIVPQVAAEVVKAYTAIR